MRQTSNKGYNLIDNSDRIKDSLLAWNINFENIDEDITSNEENLESTKEELKESIESVSSLADNYTSTKANGTSLNLTDSASAPIDDINIGNGEIEQDGEPTPSNPVEIKVVEGTTNLVAQSKNIVDWASGQSAYADITWEDDVLTVSGTGANLLANFNIQNFVKSHPGKTLHFGYEDIDLSEFSSTNATIVQIYIVNNSAPQYITMMTTNKKPIDYTIPDDTSGISLARIRIFANNTNTEETSKIVITKPQLELGEESTGYVEYKNQTYPITLPTGTFLGKIDNASNYIYGDIDNWKLSTKVLEKTLSGTESIEFSETLGDVTRFKINSIFPTISTQYKSLSSHFVYNSNYSLATEHFYVGGAGNIFIFINSSIASTVGELRTWITENKPKFYAVISETQDEEITDETLIEQLNNIKRNMTTYKGQTIVFTTTDNLHPNIDLTYKINGDIEVNQKVSTVQNEVDMLKSNFDTKTTDNSNNMNITDAINYTNQGNIKVGDGTALEQETTSISEGDEYDSPSPDHPQDIKVVEGECSFSASNKNLWGGLPSDTNTNLGITWTYNNDGTIKGNGTSTAVTNSASVSYAKSNKLYVTLPAGNYFVSGGKSSDKYLQVYTTDSVSLGTDRGNGVSFILLEKTSIIIRVGITSGTILDNEIFYIQLEQNSISTSYVSHKEQNYPITLPEGMFLGSIGTASNYIYGEKDNWKLNSEVAKIVFDGSENWTKSTTTNELDRYSLGLQNLPGSTTSTFTIGLSNYFRWSTSTNIGNFKTIAGKTSLFFDFAELNSTTLDGFKQWLAVHNPFVYYPLGISTETDITDETLITQLNNIADNLQTYKGGTIVITAGENLAPNIQFDYLQNPFSSIEARLDLLEA